MTVMRAGDEAIGHHRQMKKGQTRKRPPHRDVTADPPVEGKISGKAIWIRMRTGVPTNVDQWGWTIGFYPASHRGLRASGTAKSFDMARGAFETAWRWLSPQVRQADFVEHRQHRAHEAWKLAMREAGCKLPTEMAGGRSRCFCGAEIDIAGTEQHVYTAHMVARESA